MEIVTGAGPARAELEAPAKPGFLLVLTHGAGGGVATKDILAARRAGLAARRRGGPGDAAVPGQGR